MATTAGISRRVGNVDLLRALAALAVLGIHGYALSGRVVPVKAQHPYDVPLSALASGVWLFFAISGYVIGRPFVSRLVNGQPGPDLRGYVVRRALRIFPLYWVALAALIALQGAGGTRPWQLPFHLLLLNNLVPGRQEALFPSAWTLTLEVLFYISLPLAAAVLRARGVRRPERLAAIVLVSWGLSIAFTVVGDLAGNDEIGLWLRQSFWAMWQMFCPGLLMAIAPELGESRLRRLLVDFPLSRAAPAVVLAALVPAALLAAAAPLRFGVTVYVLLVDASRPLYAIGFGLVLARAIEAPPWAGTRTWVLELGLISYGIYLLHPIIAVVLVQAGAAPDPRNTLSAFLINTICLAALTIPLALLSWRGLERPILGWGSRMASRRSAPSM